MALVTRMLRRHTPGETRVVVVDGTSSMNSIRSGVPQALKGNIYLAKVVLSNLRCKRLRGVGGNRHGFLPSTKSTPDYYQIPVADRERLLAEQAQRGQRHDDDEDRPRAAPAALSTVAKSRTADEQRAFCHAPPTTEWRRHRFASVGSRPVPMSGSSVPEATAAPSRTGTEPSLETASRPSLRTAPRTSSGAIAASVTTDASSVPAATTSRAARETIDATGASDAHRHRRGGATAICRPIRPRRRRPEIPVETLGCDDYEPRPRRARRRASTRFKRSSSAADPAGAGR